MLLPQVRDRELYGDTDTEVKRQIWKDNQSLFGDEVSPLLSQYIKEKEHILFDHLNLTNLFFSPSPKVSAFVINIPCSKSLFEVYKNVNIQSKCIVKYANFHFVLLMMF